jgi:hypothetical protein
MTPPRRRSRPAPRLRPAVLVIVGLLASLAAGCSDKDRRLNGFEAFQYKRTLVRGELGRDTLSEAQANDFLYHPARTRREIDGVFDEYKRRHAEEKDAERARLAKEEAPDSRAGDAAAKDDGTKEEKKQ